MAISKLGAFEDIPVRLARYFKALAHPARVEIIRVLAQRGTCVCGEIVDELPLAQATVSQHLKALKEAGLIRGDIEGPSVCYCVDSEMLDVMRNEMNSYFDSVCRTTDRSTTNDSIQRGYNDADYSQRFGTSEVRRDRQEQ